MALGDELIVGALKNQNSPLPQRKGYDPTQYLTEFKSEFKNEFKDEFASEFKDEFKNEFGFNQDLDTSDGLYRLASQSGLQKEADKIIKDNSGEETKKLFSGGFISDVFDVLNATSYGVVGLMKGKGFKEGLQNRESFSDQDSLGRYGLGGVVLGTIADIVTDPLTWVAPWTVLKKIPGFTKVSKAGFDSVFGKEVSRVVDETGKVHQTREGGIGLTVGDKEFSARRAAEKFVYMFGADPVFKDIWDRGQRSMGIAVQNAKRITTQLGKVEKATAEKLFDREDILNDAGELIESGGRFKRKSLDELQNTLDQETFDTVAPIWKQIDNNSRELKNLGVLGEAKFEETVGLYLKSANAEMELAKSKGIFGAKPFGIKGIKKRKDLTAEQVEKLQLVEDPQFLLLNTMLKQTADIENTKIANQISEKFASVKEFPGSVLVPDTRRLQTKVGSTMELRTAVGSINKTIKNFQKDLKLTFKGDKKVIAESKAVQKELESVTKLRGEELTKFLNEGKVVKKTVATVRKLGTFTDALSPLAQRMRRFDTFEQMMKSKDGLRLQKLHISGTLERNNFPGGDKAMEDFFNQAKKPFKKAKTKEIDTPIKASVPKLVALQKRVEKLAEKKGKLSEIDKKSINNSFIHLERKLADADVVKDDLLDAINRNTMGQLAGKYVPKQIMEYLDEIVSPSDVMGSRVMGAFKYAKVILSVSTHVRNIVSNRILNWWKLGIGPWRVDLDVIVAKQLKTKGKYYQEASKQGMDASTFAANELPDMAKNAAVSKLGKKVQGTLEKIADIYQGEENYAKLTAFIYQRKKGLNPEKAWLAAESATFNYSQVTPFVRKLRTAIWGVPFITFPLKATPIAFETALKNPGRLSVFGKIKNNIENASDLEETAAERASEPQWVKDGFFFKLPIKDEQGRSAYFDMTYIIPMGDILSGNMFPSKIRRDTGLKETGIASIASKNPAFQVLKEIVTNQDFVGNQIYKSSDGQEKQFADIFTHMVKTFSPPQIGAQIPSTYNKDGEKIKPGMYKALTGDQQASTARNATQEAMSYFGAKIQPMDAEIQEQRNEWNKRKALQTLLLENAKDTDLSRMNRVFIPKDKR